MVYHGKSNAFKISQKLGLPSEIIENASSNLDKNHVSIEELLKNIYNEKIEIDKQKEKIENRLKEVELLKEKVEKNNVDLTQKQQDLINNAKIEAREILLSAKSDVNSIIKELSNPNISNKKANQLRNELNEKSKQYTTSIKSSENSNLEHITIADVKEGLEVFVPKLQNNGTILSCRANKNDEVLVQIGLAKMNLKLTELQLLNKNNSKNTNESKEKNSGFVTTKKITNSQSISPEINVIGQTVDDAIYVLDTYLSSCYSSNISPIRIVHGKGTGKLRTGIHTYLKKNPIVKSYRIGTYGEGEMGVTIVELK